MHPKTHARRARLWGGLLLVAGLAGTAINAVNGSARRPTARSLDKEQGSDW